MNKKQFINYDEPKPMNHMKPWADEDLEDVLSFAPTVKNVYRLAKLHDRTPSSIYWIYRYSSQTRKQCDENSTIGPKHAFVNQVRRCGKTVGLVYLNPKSWTKKRK